MFSTTWPPAILAPTLLQSETPNPAVSPITDVFLQYGALGAVCLIFIAATFKLFNHLNDARDHEADRVTAAYEKQIERIEAAYDTATARGDRLERELAELNKVAHTTAGVLAQATDAIREAMQIMHDHRRP
jgi:undecaprenyl pyrophosphate phosphatase UppP